MSVFSTFFAGRSKSSPGEDDDVPSHDRSKTGEKMKTFRVFFNRQKDGDLFPLTCLLIFAVLGYLPISSGLFALKNDDFIYFLPYRYNVSEIIRSGHLPLWSPYIYMGFPIAGDMQSGAWNPLVWLISLTGAYDLNRLAIELLMYIFISGVGMYKLGRTLRFNKLFAFTMAISFMFCGFITDSGQILCWVACASFLPFTYLYFIRLVRNPGIKNAVKFSLANLCLALAGYPAFFIINAYILLAISIILFVVELARKNHSLLKIIIPYFGLSAALFLLTGLIAWLSFAELLPYYSRGQGVSLSNALEHSYQSWYALTALTPFAYTWAVPGPIGDFGIFRNIYFGILLVPFAFYGAVVKRTLNANILLTMTVLVIASSFGNDLPLRSFEFHYLPLMNSFRHPANFRIFGIIGMLILAGKGLQQTYLDGKSLRSIRVILTSLVILLAVFGMVRSTNGWHQKNTEPIFQALKHGELFTPALIANILLQILFLIAGFIALRRGRYRLYCLLSIFNVMALAQPQIFYGMVSGSSPQSINQHIKESPKGFPANINDKPIGLFEGAKKINDYGHFTGIGSFYLKRPVINTSINNPTILAGYYLFLQDSTLRSTLSRYRAIYFGDSIVHVKEQIIVLKKPISLLEIRNQSFVLHEIKNRSSAPNEMKIHSKIKDQSIDPNEIKTQSPSSTRLQFISNEIKIHSFGPNEISFSANINDTGVISVFQNNHPGWNATIDHKPVELFTVNHTFIGVKALRGEHLYQLKYKPRWLLPGAICSLAGLIVCAWLLVRKPIASGTSYHSPY